MAIPTVQWLSGEHCRPVFQVLQALVGTCWLGIEGTCPLSGWSETSGGVSLNSGFTLTFLLGHSFFSYSLLFLLHLCMISVEVKVRQDLPWVFLEFLYRTLADIHQVCPTKGALFVLLRIVISTQYRENLSYTEQWHTGWHKTTLWKAGDQPWDQLPQEPAAPKRLPRPGW